MSDEEIVVKLSLDDRGYKVAVVSAGSVMKEFKQSLDSTATSIKKVEEHQFSLGRKFRDLVMTMGALRFVAMDVNDIFLRLPMAILKTAGELERMQVLMTGLSKELTAAGRAAEGLRDFQFVTNMAKNAPFEISALSDSFVKLKVAGIDPTNGSMNALVDAVARFGGTGESLKRASIAIQQMAGKGVVSMEELRQQLGEAVPTAMRDMADGMGVSMQELAKIVQTGTLAAGPAIAKMLLQMKINNQGAAADMMETWVGTTARFKTEMQLAAKAIADAGFADEAKKVVRELTEALQSPEFTKFGVDSGKALGDLVRGLMDVTKTLISYRSEIELLIKAWLAYKGLNLVAGAAQLIKSQGEKVKAIRSEMLAVAENSRFQQAENLRAASRDAQRTQQQYAENSRRAALLNAELAQVRSHNAAIVAADARMRAQLAVQGGVTIPGLSGFRSRDRGVQELASLAQQNSAMIAREKELATQVAATNAAMQASKVVAAEKAATLFALANASRLSGIAATGAAFAMRGLGVAMSFLGGPIGVLITAVMGLVWWWDRVGAAAEEARARHDRAMKGIGDSKDLVKNTEDLARARKKLADAERALSDGEKYRSGQSTSPWRDSQNKKISDAQKKAVDDARAEVEQAQKRVSENRRSVIEQDGRETADTIDRSVQRVVTKLSEATQLEIAAITKRQTAALEKEKEGSKEWVRVNNDANKEKQDVMLRGMRQRIAALNAAALKSEQIAMGSAEDSAVRAGALQAAKRSREMADNLQKQLDADVKTLGTKDQYKEKKDPNASKNLGDKDTPFARLIEGIAQRRAQLEAELENFNETEGKSDKAAGVMAKILKQWEQGEFKDPKTGKSPDLDQISDAVGAAAQVERDKETLKRREELAQNARRFTDFVKGMEPEYLDAIEVLQDPLGKTKMGRSEKQAFKLLGGMSEEELTAAAQRMGTTVDRVKTELINRAQTIDSVSFFQGIEQETKQINDSLVDDSREAAVKRMAADNERHAQEMRNLYEKRQASGEATGEELLRLQRIIDANMQARANQLKAKSQTPFESLASQWENVTKNMEEATARWADGTADAFTTLVTTGKADFKGLAASIIADLAKIAMKAALSPIFKMAGNAFGGFFNNLFKFENGGIMTEFGSMPLKKYANGGIANSPQLALYGEGKTPEAYVPLPDGRTIPVTLKGGAQQATAVESNNVQINITVNKDGGETTSADGPDAQMYRRLGERIKGVVREELAAQKRPGGLLYT